MRKFIPLFKKFLYTILFLLSFSETGFAYRPFVTEDAGVVGKGGIQTEMGYDYTKWDNNTADHTFLLISPHYGVTQNLELAVAVPLMLHQAGDNNAMGVGDITIAAKYAILRENNKANDPWFTVKGGVKLNTGDYDRGLGRGDIEYALSAILSKSFKDRFTFHTELGYSFVTYKKDNDLGNYFFYGVAADYVVKKPFHIVAEISGNKNPDKDASYQNQVLLGVIYEFSENIAFDASIKKGFNPASPEWGGGIGLTMTF